jgi:hypothetical protein
MSISISRIIWAATAFIAVSLARTERASAHGFEGDRFFPPTIQTDDPFATDEFSINASEFEDPAGSDGTPKTREFDVTSEFDKEIFPKFAVGVSGTYINLEPENHQGPGQDGFDNVTLSAKYQLWEDAPHEWILSLGGEVDLGDTGSKALGVDAFSTYTPTLYFGKGFGDLPNELKYLKPFALTGTIGESIAGQPTNADGSLNPNALQWGFALEYSLLYLQQHVEDIGLPKPFSQMVPLVEFSATTPENRGGETTTGTISPASRRSFRSTTTPATTSAPSSRSRSTSTTSSLKSSDIPFSSTTKTPTPTAPPNHKNENHSSFDHRPFRPGRQLTGPGPRLPRPRPAARRQHRRRARNHQVDRKDAKINGATMILSLPKLPAGTYLVKWKAVATDTHRTTGTFNFTVR